MKKFSILCIIALFAGCTVFQKNKTVTPQFQRVKIHTDSGDMVVRLFNRTPLHRDNFIKMVKSGFYNGLLFHRVIQGFMIQGGDPQSKNAPIGAVLGEGGLKKTIPAEIDTAFFHRKGALAAAREPDNINPKRESSYSQFFIVDGRKFTDSEMDAIEKQFNIQIPESHRIIYRTIGGAPFLDGKYTIFGQVVSGLEVIDKIAAAATDGHDRPLRDIEMKITLLPE